MTPTDSIQRLGRQFRGDLTVSGEPAALDKGVPDSLDLVAMARAGLNYLRGNPEPARRHECKFSLGPLGIPCHYPEWVRPNEYGYDPIFDDWVSYPGNPALGTPGTANNGIHMMGCCPPEGLRAVWEAWRWAVQDERGEVRVNLALSRDHPSARVVAWRPEDGGYEVTPLRAGRFLLRPPGWAERDGVVLRRNGAPAPVEWGGPRDAYVLCREAAIGETLRLAWPVPRFTQAFVPTSVDDRTERVTFEWVGPQVVGVHPGGRHLPMFA